MSLPINNPVMPTVGRIVLFQLMNEKGEQVLRPAIIVHVWSPILVNLQVFTDGYNDGPAHPPHQSNKWVTSAHFDEVASPGTWAWPTKG
jgi:hypothetical protein